MKNEIEIEERLKNLENLLNLNKPVYTLTDAALLVGYQESYIYKLTHQREIPHYKPRGGAIYFNPKELVEWCLTNKIPTLIDLKQKASIHQNELKNKK